VVPDLLADGAAWLAGRLAASAARTVTYSRGATSITLPATVGASAFEAASTAGVVERWESRDFIVQTSSFTTLGLPQRHDRIVDTLGGFDVTYEVASPRGVPVWHYGDAFRATMRIHTKAIEDDTTGTATQLLRWWGASAAAAITDQQIAAQLTSDKAASRVGSRSITAAAQYLYIVLPDSFGTPIFTIGGYRVTAWELTTRSITFTGQPARSYRIYRSTYAITGTVVVEVA
jgi:hypothetical protein